MVNKKKTSGAGSTVVRKIKGWRSSGARIDTSVMETLIESAPDGDWLPSEVGEVATFCAEQGAQWQVVWLFSPASDPDLNARRERDAWRAMWEHFVHVVEKSAPGVREQFMRVRSLEELGAAVRLREQTMPASRWDDYRARVLSRVAIALGRIGLESLALPLYRVALYPAGSVGRAGG